MLELVRLGQFPSFALGEWYDALQKAGKDEPLPPRLCWAASDAILLAPYRIDGFTWGGYLIAMEEAAGQEREFFNEHGDAVTLLVPPETGAAGAVAATEAAALSIAGSPGSQLPPALQPL